MNKKNRETYAQKVGFPVMYWDASLSNLSIPHSYHEAINNWIKDPTYTLILAGPTGTGKTHIAAAITNDVFEDLPLRFWRDDDLYIKAKSVLSKNWDGCDYILKHCCDSKYLIIDDLGVDEVTPYKLQCTERIIDDRYSRGKSVTTIITTNLTKRQIREKYSDRIYSRLFAKENTNIIFDGYDLRGNAKTIGIEE